MMQRRENSATESANAWRRTPVHGQTSAGDQLAHLALQLTQAAAQFLQRGEGLRRLAQLRLQPTRLIRRVTQLLGHRVVQLAGQGAVPDVACLRCCSRV